MKRFYFFTVAIILSLSSSSLIGQTTYSYTGSTDTYIVPSGVGSISILAKGSKGDNHTAGGVGGNGAEMYGEFSVSPGDVLTVYAGGNASGDGIGINSGGDGSYVENTTTGTLLIVAGGGGSAGYTQDGSGAPTTEDGNISMTHPGYPDGAAGTGGNGGGAGAGDWGSGGGGGWFSAGADGLGSPGGAMPCRGSYANSSYHWAAGAGGGYSGGGGVDMAGGWGSGGGGAGGSYNIGTAQSNVAASNAGLGEITITELCLGLVTTVSSDSVCVGDEVVLHAESAGTGTITWSGGISDSVAFVPTLGTTTYTATSDDAGDCEFSIDIVVFEIPTTDAGADVDLCEGDSVALSGSGTANVFDWTGGITDGEYFTPSAGSTTYTVTGSDDVSGCSSTDDVMVNYTVIDESVTLTASTLTAAQSGATYQWLDCPAFTPISGATAQSYTPNGNGSYAVIITLNGCVDTSACVSFINSVGLTDLNESDISAYPNPTSGEIMIKAPGVFNYSVINVAGQTILSGNGKDAELINLEAFENGQYIIQIVQDNATSSIKVIKQ